jgi:hypothetical protein
VVTATALARALAVEMALELALARVAVTVIAGVSATLMGGSVVPTVWKVTLVESWAWTRLGGAEGPLLKV